MYQVLAYARHGEEFLHYADFPAEGWGRFLVPHLTIQDHPAYKVRAFMADLGRAPYSMALLKRLVRLMAQMKLNTLHLHLFDDQLCGFRFEKLPIGHENPFSLNAADLKELVAYARRYHISVMPELKSWGHVQAWSITFPNCEEGREPTAAPRLAWVRPLMPSWKSSTTRSFRASNLKRRFTSASTRQFGLSCPVRRRAGIRRQTWSAGFMRS